MPLCLSAYLLMHLQCMLKTVLHRAPQQVHATDLSRR